MKIALIGYGKMGNEIEKIALSRGHEIASIIDEKSLNQFPDYNVKMEEVHHIHKLDAPSGTAITLAEGIIDNIDRKSNWHLENETKSTDLAIHAIREGEVPGIHEIFYESEADVISIKHDAKNRKGFALGAVLAAEFTHDKKGFLGMKDMLKF